MASYAVKISGQIFRCYKTFEGAFNRLNHLREVEVQAALDKSGGAKCNPIMEQKIIDHVYNHSKKFEMVEISEDERLAWDKSNSKGALIGHMAHCKANRI